MVFDAFGGHCLLHFLTSKLIFPFLPVTFHMVPICTHASMPSISHHIVAKKRLSALQHVLPANTLINDRRKHVQTKCSPVVFLTLHTSNMALQCYVQSYSTLVITGYHWFKTHIRQILETYGAALVKPCQVTAMLPFLGHCFQSQHHDPIHPEKSNLGKMTQLGSLHKKAIMSDLI